MWAKENDGSGDRHLSRWGPPDTRRCRALDRGDSHTSERLLINSRVALFCKLSLSSGRWGVSPGEALSRHLVHVSPRMVKFYQSDKNMVHALARRLFVSFSQRLCRQ
jgi:hypothetical protein